jgi:choline-glycine betaine transporter
MLANIATGSLVVALFSGSCAFGVGKGLSRFTRPVMYVAFALAIVLYALDFFRG